MYEIGAEGSGNYLGRQLLKALYQKQNKKMDERRKRIPLSTLQERKRAPQEATPERQNRKARIYISAGS
mgnify:CR=1 FL=1